MTLTSSRGPQLVDRDEVSGASDGIIEGDACGLVSETQGTSFVPFESSELLRWTICQSVGMCR
jgi:hypothetical protein